MPGFFFFFFFQDWIKHRQTMERPCQRMKVVGENGGNNACLHTKPCNKQVVDGCLSSTKKQMQA